MGSLFFKKALPHIVAVLTFLVVNSLYFYPQWQGKVISQPDLVSYRAMFQEVTEYEDQLEEPSYWSNGMFGGMPRTISSGKQYNVTRYFEKFLFNLGIDSPISIFLKGSLFAYLLLILLGVNPWISIIGALAFSLNTNHVVLWEAGHSSKLNTLMSFPLIFAGVLLCLRQKKYIIGGLTFALGTSLALYDEHPQMVYYLFLALAVYGFIQLIFSIKNKTLPEFGKAAGVLVLGLVLALTAAFAQLNSTMKSSEDTMRGQPVLQKANTNSAATSSSQVKGLEWNYAMQWSNGVIDLAAMIIPGIAGGGSIQNVGKGYASYNLMKQNGVAPSPDGTIGAPLYWGGLPSTSGPSYYGAVLLFLFVLGLTLFNGAMRWGTIASMIFISLLSLGIHFESFNRFLFDTLPFLNKFRAPSSSLLVVNGFFIVLAFMALQKFLFTTPKKEELLKPLMIAGGITGGFCLLMALMGGSLLDFSGAGDGRYAQQVTNIFVEDRKTLLQSDAFRSFGLIAVAMGVLFAYLKGFIKQPIVIGVLGILVLFDFWGVGRRYLAAHKFEAKTNYEANFSPRPVDTQIKNLEPKGRGYYRVFDMGQGFSNSRASYYHNTIGGYHPAKLQRYQDMIDYHLSKGNQSVLNMLNTKYFISREGQLQTNAAALGNAWFVPSIKEVATPNQEIESMSSNFNPKSEAIVLKSEFADYFNGFQAGDGNGTIEMTKYLPNHLTYQTNTTQEQLAVFSEIWYNKGWQAYIDNEPVDFVRANYTLRAMKVPAGQHTIEFKYAPFASGKILSLLASLLIALGVIGFAGWSFKNWYARLPEMEQAELLAQKKAAATAARSKVVPTKSKKSTKRKKK